MKTSKTLLGLLLAVVPSLASADSLESTSGTVLEGKIISRDDKLVVIEVQVGGKPVQRRYAIHFVRAITVDGNREVLSGAGKTTSSPATRPASGNPGTVSPATPSPAPISAPAPGSGNTRTRQEVEALIQAARTPPDWLASTVSNPPASLDLSWPERAPAPWNAQKNVGQYLWDIIYPNSGRWREGVKFMYDMMERHKGNAVIQARIANTLGGMYHHLFQDWARAAYWWRQCAGAQRDEVGLAECYWKLGNKAMAVEAMNRLDRVPMGAIKLWGDMGETDKALKMAELFMDSNGEEMAMVMAGDACRQAGRTAQAIKFYERVLSRPDDKRNKRPKDRARGSLEAVKLFDTLDLTKVPDGTFVSSALGYETQVEVEVKIAAGRIEAVKVTRHHEKQFYSSMIDTPNQIIQKQSVKGIDATSRATITSEAIINATAKALHAAMK